MTGSTSRYNAGGISRLLFAELRVALPIADGFSPCMQDGQLVSFTELKGMAELNDGKPRRIRSCRVSWQHCMCRLVLSSSRSKTSNSAPILSCMNRIFLMTGTFLRGGG